MNGKMSATDNLQNIYDYLGTVNGTAANAEVVLKGIQSALEKSSDELIKSLEQNNENAGLISEYTTSWQQLTNNVADMKDILEDVKDALEDAADRDDDDRGSSSGSGSGGHWDSSDSSHGPVVYADGVLRGLIGGDTFDKNQRIIEYYAIHKLKQGQVPIIADDGEIVVNEAQQGMLLENIKASGLESWTKTPSWLVPDYSNMNYGDDYSTTSKNTNVEINMGNITIEECNDAKQFLEGIQKGKLRSAIIQELGERKVIYAHSLNELREKEKDLAKDLDENINTERANMTLNELFDLFMGLKSNIKNTTRTNYVGLWKSDVRNSYVGNMKLPDIRKIDIMKLYSSYQKKGLSINSIKYIDVIISPTLMFAVDSDIIRKNPARNCIKEFSGSENVKYSLTQEQQKKFVDYISSSRVYTIHFPMILYMLSTACRIGEVAGLSWSKNVNLDERIITIDHQLIYKNLDGSTRFHITSPKSSSGKREIPITDEILKILMMQKKNDLATGSFCKMSIDGYDDFVFTTRQGTPLSPANVNSILVNIVNAYNKAESTEAVKEKRYACLLPHISSHILRHTACTRMAEAGIDIKILQYVMGHSDINTTMNIYNHIDSARVRGRNGQIKWNIYGNGVKMV